MRFYKYLISLCLFLIIFNCNEEQKTVFSDINLTTNNNTIVEINIPEAKGDKIVSNHINSKIKKTIISALHIGNMDDIITTSVEESITSFNNEYTNFKTDFPETPLIWEAQIDGEVMYNSAEIISIAITAFSNTGGAHGILNISFLNFDSSTGYPIQNNQLFTNSEAFKTLARSYFKDAIKDKNILLDYKQFELPKNMGYSEDGIVLLYNIQEVTPYSNDIIEFVIPFEKAESYLVFNSSH